MKRLSLLLITFVMAQGAMAQQFSLPILPQKLWPSDYAKYESDVLNCCDWLLNVAPDFNAPKHEECSSFLVRWASGAPQIKMIISDALIDTKKPNLLIAYMAAWTRYSIKNPDVNQLLCANVAVEEMLNYYFAHKDVIGKSKLAEKLLKQQEQGTLAAYITSALVK
ncbi:MAG: hypothetical protein MJZ99_03665 [Bacteroidales bacterium]|nr:hypothetical protein [Candidatus Colimorpha merdihippi]MCQ2281705.1 hypothetical protein [Bacteroidales bacterium]